MTKSIARTVMRELAQEGLSIDAGFLEALASAFRKEGIDALRRSKHLALINGLAFDDAAEQQILDAFAVGLEEVCRATSQSPSAPLPAWDQLMAERPGFVRGFADLIAHANE